MGSVFEKKLYFNKTGLDQKYYKSYTCNKVGE